MCGILGIVCRRGRFPRNVVLSALQTLHHRGPDDYGLDRSEVGDWDVWLGHRRLAIIDPSPAGHQPMWTRARGVRGAIVFNGEIYDHRALRRDLGGRFRGDSDTEVLLRGVLERGPQFLSHTTGMFAFGVLDSTQRRLTLARDRMGKKPLYVLSRPDLLAFASELKALVALDLPLTLDDEAMALFRWTGYVPGTLTIWKEVSKFPAASFAEVSLADTRLPPVRPRLFWDPLQAYGSEYRGSYDDAVDEVLGLIDEATERRLHADVPVGAFLSGGVDSSLVASSIAALGHAEISAYTIQPASADLDESEVAIQTASALGVRCERIRLDFDDYARQLDLVAHHWDEPMSDSSQIPTLAVAEAARAHVKVVLTGDGGDELFLGYPWLSYPERLWGMRRRIPGWGAHGRLSPILQTGFGRALVGGLAGRMGLNPDNAEVKAIIASELLRARVPDDLYECFKAMTQRPHLDAADRARLEGKTLLRLAREWYPDYDWECVDQRPLPERLAALDLVTFMRDDVLVKVDRATMAYGLEARSPLLDHRIVEFAQSLPLDFKIRDGVHKALLRDALRRRIPGDLADRPKMGFGAPLPADLPDGPTPAVQWSRFVERGWRDAWMPAPRRAPARVGFFITDLGPGGAERVAVEIAESMAGIEPVFLLLEDSRAYETSVPVTTLGIRLADHGPVGKAAALTRAAAQLRAAKRELELDTCVSFMTLPNILNILAGGGTRDVLTVHSTESVGLSDPRFGGVLRGLVAATYKRADGVIAVSDAVATDLVREFEVPRHLIHVVHNPVWLSRIDGQRGEPLPVELETVFDGPTVVSMGRLVNDKGHWHLIRAFAQLTRSLPTARLVLLGDGPLRDYLQSLCAELGLPVWPGGDADPAGSVVFAGFHPNPFPILQRADVFAFPSLLEGFGNALLEALACGLPAVASDCVAGPREILAPSLQADAPAVSVPTDVEFGVLMPPLDGMKRSGAEPLTAEEALWAGVLDGLLTADGGAALRRTARTRAAQFDIPAAAAAWRRVLVG